GGMSEALTERQAFLILNALPNIGPITTNRLLEKFDGNPCAIFSAGARQLESVKGVGPVISATLAGWREHFDLEKEEKKIAQAGVEFITSRDAGYPPMLKEIHDPPI